MDVNVCSRPWALACLAISWMLSCSSDPRAQELRLMVKGLVAGATRMRGLRMPQHLADMICSMLQFKHPAKIVQSV